MSGIKQIPPESRPRERLARLGASALSDVELLAILLRSGMRQKSALVIAQEILAQCRDVEGLSRARHAQLSGMSGMGESKAAQVLAAVELGRRVMSGGSKPRQKLSSPRDVCAYLQTVFKGMAKEQFLALHLNSKNKLIGQEWISAGILDASHAHPREVFQGAIVAGAKSIIVAHNHPSGDPAPSREDAAVTRRLCEAGRLLGIALLDHVIVGDQGCFSMREEGDWEETS